MGQSTGQKQHRRYEIVTDLTYAETLHQLRKACLADPLSLQPTYSIDGQELPRLFSCKEILEARLNDSNTEHNPDGSPRTEQDREKLLSTWSDICTLVAYQGGTTKFKIVPISEQLLCLPRNFDGASVPLSFSEIAAEELDRAAGMYNTLLSKLQVLGNPGWLQAAEDDRTLLGTYFDLISRLTGRDKMMGFYLFNEPSRDQGRALCVGDLDDSSGAGGDCGLNDYGSSLRVAQSIAPARRAPKKVSAGPSLAGESKNSVLEILSRFDFYVSPAAQEAFQQEKQRAIKDISNLLKNG